MFGCVEVNQPPRTDLQRHKHINHSKARCHNRKEIASYDCVCVIFRKLDQRWSLDPRGRGGCLLYLATVRGESRICSFSNSSSAMRCSPQVGFSAAKRRIKFLTSTVTRGLPTVCDAVASLIRSTSLSIAKMKQHR